MANIRQIAKLAKVSVTTVSRVLNHHPYVSEDKRRAVLDAFRQLNYSRNINAVHLAQGRTNMVGVMLPFVDHAYFSRILEGISGEALGANYRLLLCQTSYEEEEERKALELLKEKQIDGLIICSKTLPWEQIEPYTSYGPIVACENTEQWNRISSVYIDHYAAFRFGMEHLISRGHRRIGYCLSRSNSASSSTRRRAYRDMLTSIGEEERQEWMFTNCYGIEDGVEVVRRLLSMKERPSALVVTGDHVAAGIIEEARNVGLSVPEELAIIGFDNHPISKVLQLTTIDNGLLEIGGGIFRLLHRHMNEENHQPEHIEMPFRFMERSTV